MVLSGENPTIFRGVMSNNVFRRILSRTDKWWFFITIWSLDLFSTVITAVLWRSKRVLNGDVSTNLGRVVAVHMFFLSFYLRNVYNLYIYIYVTLERNASEVPISEVAVSEKSQRISTPVSSPNFSRPSSSEQGLGRDGDFPASWQRIAEILRTSAYLLPS